MITVYAANKYHGAWKNILKNTEQNALSVSVIQRDGNANYRGVWYSNNSKMELTAHSMIVNGDKTQLHHQASNFSEKQRQSRDIQDKAMHIAATNMTNINGFSGIFIAGWC
ncbi:hypothetical protein WCV21_09390 [Lactobacillus helveticus]|uniref:Uncharacterized protein n=1 Tax=Lactobacillus helveticus TaxID=1587 RepID=A0AAV4E615_LACHE|nr:hypothetical protein [Lactobacillus helveticus]EGF35227.1 hypothetical protein AAULH_12491 [Lactobacillus helveticus MTCC 5463]KXN78440.1 hypothetical protein AY471_09860 [Lactobacillus helveticus]SPS15292.1 hypothetical protein BDKNPLJD_02141 [Lactobacillus helveticus]BCD39045.1 hypothetical protein LBHL_16020 [Lactobacillus helveticus]GFP12444.1 hypothetical protein LHEJCM1062_03160 [Lactobacillus helveticus]